jgi:hypothetical protein
MDHRNQAYKRDYPIPKDIDPPGALMDYKAKIAVFGGRTVGKDLYADAVEIGRLMAEENWLVFCGGGTGVMEAVARGVKEGGGICIGILKGTNLKEGNPYLTLPIKTGLGVARNALLAYNCDAAVAIDGQYGTLSEIAYAMQLNKPVIGYKSWSIPKLESEKTPSLVIKRLKNIISSNK